MASLFSKVSPAKRWAAFAFTLMLVTSGCASGPMTTREKGAGLGAIIGAGAGAIIGNQSGHKGEGALIGAAIGGLGGAAAGDQVQGQEQANQALGGELSRQQQELAANQELINKLRARNLNADQGKRGVVVTLPDVLFEFGSADLTAGAQATARDIAEIILSDAPGRRISVEGHTDSIGPANYNQSLSERRAASVAAALRGARVGSDRLVSKGFGESFPAAPNTLTSGGDNPEGRARNRRVEVVILNAGKV